MNSSYIHIQITGGGNGLGRIMGLKFAMEGCHVAVVDIDFEAAVKTANEIQLCNVKSMAYKVRSSIICASRKVVDNFLLISIG